MKYLQTPYPLITAIHLLTLSLFLPVSLSLKILAKIEIHFLKLCFSFLFPFIAQTLHFCFFSFLLFSFCSKGLQRKKKKKEETIPNFSSSEIQSFFHSSPQLGFPHSFQFLSLSKLGCVRIVEEEEQEVAGTSELSSF